MLFDSNPSVVFIDGPNAVGKTFFMENFMAVYQAKFPSHRIKIFNASEYSYERRRTARVYDSLSYPDSELDHMFLGHLELLTDIQRTVMLNEADLILVNRSLFSFTTYNLRYQHLEVGSEECSRVLRFRNKAVAMYVQIFEALFSEIATLYVGLTIHADHETAANIMSERIHQRPNINPVSLDHLVYLLESYDNPDKGAMDMFMFNKSIESGDYKTLLDEYFR